MINSESKLLLNALTYENGHPRRTQHILKVYTLTKLLGEACSITNEEQIILHAAAILHDIPIKYCKEKYNGDACQKNQQKEAPQLVNSFLNQAGYPDTCYAAVLELVLNHHNYDSINNPLLQLLIEADIIINCYECEPDSDKLTYYNSFFVTETGKKLFQLIRNV